MRTKQIENALNQADDGSAEWRQALALKAIALVLLDIRDLLSTSQE